jgi:hypothetical protein
MPAGGGFHLDRDQRQSLHDCLEDIGEPLLEPVDRFFERIEASIDHYLRTKPEGTFREAHDSLRDLWLLCQHDHPCPARLRRRLHMLPPRALEFLGRRAPIVIARLFDEAIIGDPLGLPNSFLLAWAGSVPDDKLVALHRDYDSLVVSG